MQFGWLKRRMPRGLHARAALILIVPIVTLQLVISLSFIQRHFEGVTRQMTRSVLYELAFVAAEAREAPDLAAARADLSEIGPPLGLDVTLPSTPPAGDSRLWTDLTGGRVIAALREGLPELIAVRLPDRKRVWLWLDTPYGPMEVAFDRARVSASNPHQLLVLILVLGLLMTLIAFLFLRNQLRPIARMAQAAAEYGRGRIVPYAPSGATEVRAAGTAFLDMRARIERQAAARTMMLSGVSHDLRTPLTRLRLGLSLMDDEEAASLIRDVDEMQRLTDAFLDFARGDAGDAVEEMDPGACVAVVVEAARRGGAVVTLLPPVGSPGALPIRPVAIRRAVENLLANATRNGSRAEVGVHYGEKAIRITVEDDGPGIPPGQREEAMRPFVRLDPARNQDLGSGVGLGLAIVLDVARSHGGSLRLGESAGLGGLQADLVLPR